ncbi:hypothetical protein CC1G_14776 [Coprinopsis cinerea okayama7|uniref:Uncharacterized protein n=1 Tax=Coprinopsis cinerea (strain Okayama-7 / 130 / ATCC MYA-4618 / FGSC 9003) TaxID=240176 RepID=D6RNT6_COPC7|nr:hypothetical protein CC1G_14776 [Coprinopsis cinerea okayama7\|eukprot:XP_002910798.1 hypothetical protein CC1G_14776 [Coprinopsis cinerea okayama7\
MTLTTKMTISLPPEVQAYIVQYCPREAWVPLISVNRLFKDEVEPLLYRSIVIDSRRNQRAKGCLETLSAHSDKAMMVRQMKVSLFGTADRSLVDKILACAELMKDLKHLDLKFGLEDDWDDSLTQKLHRGLVFAGQYQLSSLLYHPIEFATPEAQIVPLIDCHKTLDVLGFWYLSLFSPGELLYFLKLVVPHDPGKPSHPGDLEPYYPGNIRGESGFHLPAIYGVTPLDELGMVNVGICPGLYAEEEQRLSLCPKIAAQLSTMEKDQLTVGRLMVHWSGLTSGDLTVSELERFAESVSASFPALEVLQILTRSRPASPADKIECYNRLREGLAPLARTPIYLLQLLPWNESSEEHGSDLEGGLTAGELCSLGERWGLSFPHLKKLRLFGQDVGQVGGLGWAVTVY